MSVLSDKEAQLATVVSAAITLIGELRAKNAELQAKVGVEPTADEIAAIDSIVSQLSAAVAPPAEPTA
jgi:hypothetical protein